MALFLVELLDEEIKGLSEDLRVAEIAEE